jgi:hypothetical protein
VSNAVKRGEVKARERRGCDIMRCAVRDPDTGEMQCALCYKIVPSSMTHIKNQFVQRLSRTSKLEKNGCLATYLKGDSGHTDEERARVEKSTCMRDVKEQILREFGGSVANATASSTNGQYGCGKGVSGQTEEQLAANQAGVQKIKNLNLKRATEQLGMTQAAFKKLPKDVKHRVQVDTTLTLADIGFDRHGAVVKQSVKKVQPVKKKQPDFDFTKDDD